MKNPRWLGAKIEVVVKGLCSLVTFQSLMKHHFLYISTTQERWKNFQVWPKIIGLGLYVSLYIILNLKTDSYCKAELRQPQEHPQKSHEQDIVLKRLLINRSMFAFYRTSAMNYFASLGIFMRQRRRTQR